MWVLSYQTYYYKNYYASNFTEMVMKEKTTFKFSRPDIFDKYPYQEELKSILKNWNNKLYGV